MDDEEFEALRAEIDLVIDGTPDPHVGISMGFGLAGEFIIRNLLTLVYVSIGGINWDMRTYRDRFVFPDPSIDDREYLMGRHNGS